MLSFEWDESNTSHLEKHGITPEEAEQVILNEPIDLEMQVRGGEPRNPQVGETDLGRVLVVVTTWRRGLARVVTAFTANKQLRKRYAIEKGKRNERGTEEEEIQE